MLVYSYVYYYYFTFHPGSGLEQHSQFDDLNNMLTAKTYPAARGLTSSISPLVGRSRRRRDVTMTMQARIELERARERYSTNNSYSTWSGARKALLESDVAGGTPLSSAQ